MNCNKRESKRTVLAGALASFIFVCMALMSEGIQMVAQESNGASETITGSVKANLPVGVARYAIPDRTKRTTEADIHNDVSVKQADRQADMAGGGETQAGVSDEAKESRRDLLPTDREKQERMSDDGRAVCLPSGSIVRRFGWLEEGGAWRYHTGIDVAVAGGSGVRAASSGTIRRIEQRAGGYMVEVAAQDKLWQYEPLGEVSVMIGDRVRIGERLGRAAVDTDRLHIACRQGGEWSDPQTVIRTAKRE